MRDEVTSSVQKAVSAVGHLPGALLPVLHAIQDDLGYVPPEAVDPVAKALNLSRAEVHGVITFYHDFHMQHPGRHVVQLCRAEACQAMGADRIAERVKARLGIDFHETTDDGAVTLKPVYCLGNCACAPSAVLDGQIKGRLRPEQVDAWLAQVEKK